MTFSVLYFLHLSFSNAFHWHTLFLSVVSLPHTHLCDITCSGATVEPRQGQMLTQLLYVIANPQIYLIELVADTQYILPCHTPGVSSLFWS